ncbi:MAG: hypothetical protein AB7S78_11160 [Candidatus Omnitrophota bacterium]
MAARTNNMSNTLLIVVVVILCAIFMANSWVSYEIEETKKITTPANPTTQKMRLNNALRTSSQTNDQSTFLDTSELMSEPDNELSATPKKKRQKIIYEIPLDDVNLVQ